MKYFRKFRIYPDSNWVYFDVFIYTSRTAMLKDSDQPKDVVGLCKGWLTGHVPSGCIKPKIGEIYLHKKNCTVGISAHEICHAVHRYFWVRKELKLGYGLIDYQRGEMLASHREESFCWVLGNLYRQFCVNYHFSRSKQFKPEKQITIKPIPHNAISKSFQ